MAIVATVDGIITMTSQNTVVITTTIES